MKQIVLTTIIFLIPILLIDGLFFLLVDCTACPDAMLAGLTGINIGYLSLLLIPLAAPKSKGTQILSGTLYLIGAFYILAELIAGGVFMIWPTQTILLPVVVQTALFALYVIILLCNIVANNATQSSINAQRQQSRIKHNRADEVMSISEIVDDSECKQMIIQCYTELRNAPLASSPDILPIEQELDNLIALLNNHALEGNTDRIKATVKQIRLTHSRRNNKLKYLTNY